jgi:hypothetical protein
VLAAAKKRTQLLNMCKESHQEMQWRDPGSIFSLTLSLLSYRGTLQTASETQ